MVGGFGCDHVDSSAQAKSSENPDELIPDWNKWATEEAANRSATAGHTPERAAAFLAAM
jgi:hypothetical protein